MEAITVLGTIRAFYLDYVWGSTISLQEPFFVVVTDTQNKPCIRRV